MEGFHTNDTDISRTMAVISKLKQEISCQGLFSKLYERGCELAMLNSEYRFGWTAVLYDAEITADHETLEILSDFPKR